jgi:hypothetical protein
VTPAQSRCVALLFEQTCAGLDCQSQHHCSCRQTRANPKRHSHVMSAKGHSRVLRTVRQGSPFIRQKVRSRSRQPTARAGSGISKTLGSSSRPLCSSSRRQRLWSARRVLLHELVDALQTTLWIGAAHSGVPLSESPPAAEYSQCAAVQQTSQAANGSAVILLRLWAPRRLQFGAGGASVATGWYVAARCTMLQQVY